MGPLARGAAKIAFKSLQEYPEYGRTLPVSPETRATRETRGCDDILWQSSQVARSNVSGMLQIRRRPDPTRSTRGTSRGALPLRPGDRVAVIGGGPAGTFFCHTLLRLGRSIRLPLSVDIYDPREFAQAGPSGCAHCGGIVSESLVQILATEGLRLPGGVVQRGIASYVVHLDVGTVAIGSARFEERIAALFRGNGPRGAAAEPTQSFDGHLLERALEDGARHVPRLVTGIVRQDGLPVLLHPDGSRSDPYQLVVVASGINSQLTPLLLGRRAPDRSRTYISEFRGNASEIERRLGRSMHVFLLDLPHLEFAALIPKGEHVTLCMLGEGIDETVVRAFLDAPEVRSCLPPTLARAVCNCAPLINTRGRVEPFFDRLVLIGDAGVTRLYKDGIGAAFRTAKAAAETALLFGVSEGDFRRHYRPICRAIEADNRMGRAIFAGTIVFKKLRFARRAVLHMASAEQQRKNGPRPMSSVLWNLFTGSAPYREILSRALQPSFLVALGWSVLAANTWSRQEVRNGDTARPPVS